MPVAFLEYKVVIEELRVDVSNCLWYCGNSNAHYMLLHARLVLQIATSRGDRHSRRSMWISVKQFFLIRVFAVVDISFYERMKD